MTLLIRLADNPLEGEQRDLRDYDLRRFLKGHREIARLSAIVAGGFRCENPNAWTHFLFDGVYDPRLFLFTFRFVKEEPQKRGRFE